MTFGRTTISAMWLLFFGTAFIVVSVTTITVRGWLVGGRALAGLEEKYPPSREIQAKGYTGGQSMGIGEVMIRWGLLMHADGGALYIKPGCPLRAVGHRFSLAIPRGEILLEGRRKHWVRARVQDVELFIPSRWA